MHLLLTIFVKRRIGPSQKILSDFNGEIIEQQHVGTRAISRSCSLESYPPLTTVKVIGERYEKIMNPVILMAKFHGKNESKPGSFAEGCLSRAIAK